MPRRGIWSSLSQSYQQRLQRGGITPEAYESGASLRSARGHARTPEHPGQGYTRPEFRQYYEERFQESADTGTVSDEVVAQLAQRIEQVFGNRIKFQGAHDPNFPPTGAEPTDDEQILETLALDDFELEEAARSGAWWLWYH